MITEQEPSWKKKQFEILCKIDEVCRSNNIDLYLCDSTALKAYCEGKLSDSVFVAIEPKDAFRFINAMETQSNYGVRSIYNYYHYPEFDIKVYDENTIDFNLSTFRNFGFCGLYVTVKFIMHLPDKKKIRNAYLKDLKAYKQYVDRRYDDVNTDMNKRVRLQLFMSRLTTKERFYKSFFKVNTKRFSGNTKKIQLGEATCDGSIFASKSTASINGREFYITGKPEEYFSCRYGIGWETRGVGPYEEHNYRFRDGDHSWEEFKEYISYLDFDEYYKKRNISRANNKKIKPLEKIWQRDKYIVERTHLRFVFWQKYMPIKDKLVELHNSGSFEELKELMEPYLKQLERFGNSKLAIYFDEDIYNIAIDIFRNEGKEKLANTLQEIVPQEHRNGMIIKNYRGEQI